MKTTILKAIGAVISGWWLSTPVALKILLTLCFVDVISSVFNSTRHIKADIKRIVLSVLIVLIIFYVYALAKLQAGFNLGFDVASAACVFYILGEFICIARNLTDAGVPLPPQLIKLLAQAEGLTKTEKEEISALQLKQEQESTALDLKQDQKREDHV